MYMYKVERLPNTAENVDFYQLIKRSISRNRELPRNTSIYQGLFQTGLFKIFQIGTMVRTSARPQVEVTLLCDKLKKTPRSGYEKECNMQRYQ
jgi:hypothetical protein